MDHHSCKPYLRQWWRAALDQPILEEATFEWEEGRSVLSVPACFGSASLPAARAQYLLPSSPDHPRNRIGRLWWHIYHHVQDELFPHQASTCHTGTYRWSLLAKVWPWILCPYGTHEVGVRQSTFNQGIVIADTKVCRCAWAVRVLGHICVV